MVRKQPLLQRLWRESWTALWGWSKVIAGATLAIVHYAGKAVNDPGVHDALSAISLPVYVGLGIAVLGFITLASMEHVDSSS